MEDHSIGSDSVSRGSSPNKKFTPKKEEAAVLSATASEAVVASPEQEEEEEKSFLDHLEELRGHLLRSVAAIFVFALAAFLFPEFIFGIVLLGPSKLSFPTYQAFCQMAEVLNASALCIDSLPFTVQSRIMFGQFAVHITSSIAIGFICAFPYAFWEIWRFVKPGLYDDERKVSRGATFAVSCLFMMGVFFGYFLVTPLSVNFLSNYQVDPSIVNEIDITSYINTVVSITLACAIMFQLPMVVYFLSKVGIVTPSVMKQYRKHAIVVILLLGAIITPPDVFSQILVAIPVSVLYEASIIISARVEKKHLAALGMEEDR